MAERTIIRMQNGCAGRETAAVFQILERAGHTARLIPHADGCLIMAEGHVDGVPLEGLRGVSRVISTSSPFPLASLDVFPHGTRPVEISSEMTIGGGRISVMAGPCAVESREQIFEAARIVSRAGGTILRGGAFKPRTNPYSFQGLGSEGIALLREAGRANGLPIISEVMSPEAVEWLLPHVDIFQVGARNMQNFDLLKALGRVDKPVMLKRGAMATVDEWLQAAEYILAGGNSKVILCERGIRSFSDRTRNTLDLSVVPLVKSLSHLPIIVDPSHGTGIRDLVIPMSLAALAAGADGIMVEVHPRPSEALSDGAQSLTPELFSDLMRSISRLLPAVERPKEEERRCLCAPVV